MAEKKSQNSKPKSRRRSSSSRSHYSESDVNEDDAISECHNVIAQSAHQLDPSVIPANNVTIGKKSQRSKPQSRKQSSASKSLHSTSDVHQDDIVSESQNVIAQSGHQLDPPVVPSNMAEKRSQNSKPKSRRRSSSSRSHYSESDVNEDDAISECHNVIAQSAHQLDPPVIPANSVTTGKKSQSSKGKSRKRSSASKSFHFASDVNQDNTVSESQNVIAQSGPPLDSEVVSAESGSYLNLEAQVISESTFSVAVDPHENINSEDPNTIKAAGISSINTETARKATASSDREEATESPLAKRRKFNVKSASQIQCGEASHSPSKVHNSPSKISPSKRKSMALTDLSASKKQKVIPSGLPIQVTEHVCLKIKKEVDNEGSFSVVKPFEPAKIEPPMNKCWIRLDILPKEVLEKANNINHRYCENDTTSDGEKKIPKPLSEPMKEKPMPKSRKNKLGLKSSPKPLKVKFGSFNKDSDVFAVPFAPVKKISTSKSTKNSFLKKSSVKQRKTSCQTAEVLAQRSVKAKQDPSHLTLDNLWSHTENQTSKDPLIKFNEPDELDFDEDVPQDDAISLFAESHIFQGDDLSDEELTLAGSPLSKEVKSPDSLDRGLDIDLDGGSDMDLGGGSDMDLDGGSDMDLDEELNQDNCDSGNFKRISPVREQVCSEENIPLSKCTGLGIPVENYSGQVLPSIVSTPSIDSKETKMDDFSESNTLSMEFSTEHPKEAHSEVMKESTWRTDKSKEKCVTQFAELSGIRSIDCCLTVGEVQSKKVSEVEETEPCKSLVSDDQSATFCPEPPKQSCESELITKPLAVVTPASKETSPVTDREASESPSARSASGSESRSKSKPKETPSRAVPPQEENEYPSSDKTQCNSKELDILQSKGSQMNVKGDYKKTSENSRFQNYFMSSLPEKYSKKQASTLLDKTQVQHKYQEDMEREKERRRHMSFQDAPLPPGVHFSSPKRVNQDIGKPGLLPGKPGLLPGKPGLLPTPNSGHLSLPLRQSSSRFASSIPYETANTVPGIKRMDREGCSVALSPTSVQPAHPPPPLHLNEKRSAIVEPTPYPVRPYHMQSGLGNNSEDRPPLMDYHQISSKDVDLRQQPFVYGKQQAPVDTDERCHQLYRGYCTKFLKHGPSSNCKCSMRHEIPSVPFQLLSKELVMSLLKCMSTDFSFWIEQKFKDFVYCISGLYGRSALLEIAELLWMNDCKNQLDKKKLQDGMHFWRDLAIGLQSSGLYPSKAAQELLHKVVGLKDDEVNLDVIDHILEAIFPMFIQNQSNVWDCVKILVNLTNFEIPTFLLSEILRDTLSKPKLEEEHLQIRQYLVTSRLTLRTGKEDEEEALHYLHKFLIMLRQNNQIDEYLLELEKRFATPRNVQCHEVLDKEKSFHITKPVSTKRFLSLPKVVIAPVKESKRITSEEEVTSSTEGLQSSLTRGNNEKMEKKSSEQNEPGVVSEKTITQSIKKGKPGKSVAQVAPSQSRAPGDHSKPKTSLKRRDAYQLIKDQKFGAASGVIKTWRTPDQRQKGWLEVSRALMELSPTDKVKHYRLLLNAVLAGIVENKGVSPLTESLTLTGFCLLKDLLDYKHFSEAKELYDIIWEKLRPHDIEKQSFTQSCVWLMKAEVHISNGEIRDAYNIVMGKKYCDSPDSWETSYTTRDFEFRDRVCCSLLEKCKSVEAYVANAESLFIRMLEAKDSYNKINVAEKYFDCVLRSLIRYKQTSKALNLLKLAHNKHDITPNPITARLLVTTLCSLSADQQFNHSPEMLYLLHQLPYKSALPQSVEGCHIITVRVESVWFPCEVRCIIKFLLNCHLTNLSPAEELPDVAVEILEFPLPTPNPEEEDFPLGLQSTDPSVKAMEQRVLNALTHPDQLVSAGASFENNRLFLDKQRVETYVTHRRINSFNHNVGDRSVFRRPMTNNSHNQRSQTDVGHQDFLRPHYAIPDIHSSYQFSSSSEVPNFPGGINLSHPGSMNPPPGSGGRFGQNMAPFVSHPSINDQWQNRSGSGQYQNFGPLNTGDYSIQQQQMPFISQQRGLLPTPPPPHGKRGYSQY